MSFWKIFWLTNVHFAIELFVTLVSLVVVFILFSAWKSKKELRFALRGLGFLAFAAFSAVGSPFPNGQENLDPWLSGIKCLAFFLIAISFFVDPLQRTPKKASNPSPAAAFISLSNNLSLSLEGTSLFLLGTTIIRIAVKTFKGMERELKKPLLGFLFLFLAELISISELFRETPYIILSNLGGEFGAFWIAAHLTKLLGFIFIASWAWGYLRFKLFSQVVGAFIAVSLVIFISITFVYTSLLVRTMQQTSLESLKTNLQTFEYAVEKLKDRALSTASVVASNQSLKAALADNKSEVLNGIVEEQMFSSGMDFLAIAGPDQSVLARAEALESVEEVLATNPVISSALGGERRVDLASNMWINAPQILIEAAVPIDESGAVYTGYVVDNAFVDGIKLATGIDITMFGGAIKSATTLTGPDGSSRLVGVMETDEAIKNKVLKDGEIYLGLSRGFNREYLSAYGPLKDSNGQILGMLSVSYPSILLYEAAQDSLYTTFYATAILAVLSFLPAYLLAKFIEEHQV